MVDNTSAERKTNTTELDAVVITASRYKKTTANEKKENVLNNFRSYTYSFTLAAIRKSDAENPKYTGSDLDIVIAKSGGKGVQNMPGTSPEAIGFNKSSPGRFDFFIDNVEISTDMAFSEKGSTTLPATLKFEIVEPYSVNGFIEALHIAALTADFPTYAEAVYVLKMQFLGYPDNVDLPEPEPVKKATRYFMFKMSEVELDVSEKGTRYRCAGNPHNQMALGQPNILKEPVSLQGSTVQSALENFFKNINNQLIAADKSGKTGASAGNHDVYEIKFPDIVNGKEIGSSNKIGESKIAEPLRENQLYAFLDPATSTKANAMQTGKSTASSIPADYVMKDTQIQFAEGRRINEAISAVIRDSNYPRDILKDVADKTDEFGMITYFTVITETIPLKNYDAVSKRPFKKYVFKVVPYQVHVTSVPGYESVPYKVEKLDPIIWRRYNYLYTGKNIDILNFKLNFKLAFQAQIPLANANNDTPGATRGAAPDSTVNVKSVGSNIEAIKSDQNSGGTVVTTPSASSVSQVTDGTAGQVSDDPYWTLARNMHSAIVDYVGGSLLMGELEILGDPFYLVTGAFNNTAPEGESTGITKTGEAAHLYGPVIIGLEFRNPQDIGTFEQGGLLQFQDNERVPFGGVYRVSRVDSTFKEGQFKQVLKIERLNAQLPPESKTVPGNLRDVTATEPNKQDTPVTDTTNASSVVPATSRTPKLPAIQPPSLAPLAAISAKDIASTVLSAAASNFKNPLAALAEPKTFASSILSKFGK
jgi:hypothetical protein